MKRTLKIESSKYSIEYEEGKEWNYSVKRCGVDTGSDLKTNIVSDMFQMILNLQTENEKLKAAHKNSLSRVAITNDGKTLRAFADEEATSYSIPDGVTMIEQRAFSELENLKSVDELPTHTRDFSRELVGIFFSNNRIFIVKKTYKI